MIHIIDYGTGNLGSIQNMLKKVGSPSIITNDPGEIAKAEKLILAGVGSFDQGMKNLESLNLIPVLREKVLNEKVPFLGICLGMQLILHDSEEGAAKGLGWVKGRAARFNFSNSDPRPKVPHMGWNTLEIKREFPLFSGILERAKFYFVHSFHATDVLEENIVSFSHYGYTFVSVLSHENIIGVQFHPEKSHVHGLNLLKNFMGKY